ncbi:glycosyltransferase family 4 protein [Glaciibacter flavus]|uniref:glycosyltransferase family 4 protein n=1 Tax=Orlajensenia flava TaxID=2565934 RepID=UPI003B00C7BF
MSLDVDGLRTSTGTAFTAWHVGRRGEVAGGMTQVLNGYLEWQFADCRVDVIISRDGSSGLRAMRLFAAAAARLLSLRDPRTNAVVVHLSQGGSFVREGLLLRLAAARGFGTIAHLHGSSFVDFAQANPERVRAVLRRADRVFVLSDETADAVRALVPDAVIDLVPNAVPGGGGSSRTHRVVFGGAVSRRKGVDVLVEAWRSVEHHGWTLDIVGPTADEDVIVDDLADATFHGALPHDQLMALLDDAAIAVLPSREEAMPMFILEALARGCAVIATRVGGVPEVLVGGAGLLVEPADIRALTGALQSLIDDAGALSTVQAAGRQRFAEAFSASAVYPRVADLWRGVLTRPAAAPRA